LHLTPVENPAYVGQCYSTSESVLYGGDHAYRAYTGPDATQLDQTRVVDADGTTYTFAAGNYASYNIGPTTSLFVATPTKIEDRNGNLITFPGANGAWYTDTMGRSPIKFSYGQNSQTIAVSGVSTPYTVTWQQVPMSYSVPFSLVPGQSSACLQVAPAWSPTSTNVITSITLPNGQQYQFSYDPTYGVLKKITYPTGAWGSYDWSLVSNYAEGTFTGQQEGWMGDVTSTHCAFSYGMVMITGRHVSFDGQHDALTQSFSYGPSYS